MSASSTLPPGSQSSSPNAGPRLRRRALHRRRGCCGCRGLGGQRAGAACRPFRPPAHPDGARLGLGGAEPPARVHQDVHQPLRRCQWPADARGHRRPGPAAAADPRLAPDLVRLAHGHARAGPGLPGHRGRPARDRADRQAPGRLRHRQPGRRHGRADGRRWATGASPCTGPTPGCRSPTPWPPTTGTGSSAWSSPRRPSPGVSPSPPLFLPPLLNARLWHLMFNQLPAEVNERLVKGREDIFFGSEFAVWAARPTARGRRQLLHRHPRLRQARPARQLRMVPGARHHHRAGGPARDSAADPAGAGHRRSSSAPVKRSRPRCGWSPTTCRAWSSPAAAIGLPRRRPRSCWRR